MTRKPKPVRRTKTLPRGRAGKSTGGFASKPDAIDALIGASAAALALPIDPAWHANVRFHLQLTLAHAALVDEFPLPDEIEAAPVFHA
jgi:hypothetical protein